MYPHIARLDSDPDLPADSEVVVIGGGIVGVCTAYYLARAGVPVTLLEKGALAAEQSSRNWGWVRTLGRDLAEVPLSLESLRLWDALARELPDDTGFVRSGIYYASETAQDRARHEQWRDDARQLGVEVDWLDRAATRAHWPQAERGGWHGVLHAPVDGRAEPHLASVAIARGARRAGARLVTGCAVRGLETAAGRVASVVTERGEIRCRQVVLAGGAWSRLFLRRHGIRLPQLKVVASVMRTAPIAGGPSAALGAHDYAFRRRADGGYTIAQRSANLAPITPDSFRFLGEFLPALSRQYSELRLRLGRTFLDELATPTHWALDAVSPFERVRVLDPAPSEAILAEARERLTAVFPGFAQMQVVQRWAGVMDVTPDALPVIGEVPSLPGLFLSTGYSGHGFGIAPGAGRLMSELLTGATPVVDPRAFRFERLAR